MTHARSQFVQPTDSGWARFEAASKRAVQMAQGLIEELSNGYVPEDMKVFGVFEKIGEERRRIAESVGDHDADYGRPRWRGVAGCRLVSTHTTFPRPHSRQICAMILGGALQAHNDFPRLEQLAADETTMTTQYTHPGVSVHLEVGVRAWECEQLRESGRRLSRALRDPLDVELREGARLPQEILGYEDRGKAFLTMPMEYLRSFREQKRGLYDLFRTMMGVTECFDKTLQKKRCTGLLPFLARMPGSEKTLYVQATVGVELIPGKFCALSEYYHMVGTSSQARLDIPPVLCFHPDTFALRDVLKIINGLFLEIMRDKPIVCVPHPSMGVFFYDEGILNQKLMKVGYMRYLVSHACMFSRGSAWSAEIFDAALLSVLTNNHYPLTLNSGIDIDAFLYPPPQFLEKYVAGVKVNILRAHGERPVVSPALGQDGATMGTAI
jgi:hypothetical protein